MTKEQAEDLWVFVQFIDASPAGVQFMGVMVDTDLVVRTATPLLAAVASVVSYTVATMDVAFGFRF